MSDLAGAAPPGPQPVDGASAADALGASDAAAARSAYLGAMRLVPGAVAVLASAADGRRTGLAVTAWTSLSADPPTLLACVNEKASAYRAILEAGAFSLNLLGADHEETVAIFSAQRGLAGGDRFLEQDWRVGALGQPVFAGAVASFVCRLAAVHHQATHGIFIGAVVDQAIRGAPIPTLLYVDGRFTRALEAPPASERDGPVPAP